MKIRCDVCEKQEAQVFCCADEAVLCGDCDWRVHNVNKLASRHRRYTLLSSSGSSKKPSLCDICQVKRALLFCQEDRAILCRDCDLSTHNANEFTQKHNRYLLTGVQISDSTSYSSLSSSSYDATLSHNNHNSSSLLDSSVVDIANSSVDSSNVIHGPEEIPMSSINEYLLETLPGWHLDDFLGSAPPSNYCKINDDEDETAASHFRYYLYGSNEAAKCAYRKSSEWSDTGCYKPPNNWYFNQHGF